MVSIRCKMAVKVLLKEMGLHFVVVDLGEVEVMETLSESELAELKEKLHHIGLELMEDKKMVLIAAIQEAIKQLIHFSGDAAKLNYSEYISTQLNCDYSMLSNLFSEVKGITIQQFIIQRRIERAKELLYRDGLTLTEIAYQLNYSSVAHLSNQFKKVTGLTPSQFNSLKTDRQSQVEETDLINA